MGDMSIGSKVNVTLGNRRVEVTVTEKNKAMLADGDLTNDLARVNGAPAEAAGISAEKFAAAGFAGNETKLLARMSRGVAKVELSDAALGPQKGNFTSIVNSKPYLRVNGNAPTLEQLQGRLNAMTASNRNGVLSELATETAMLQVRGQALGAVPANLREPLGKIAGTPYQNQMNDMVAYALDAMGGASEANRTTLKALVLNHPDIPLAQKHQALKSLGMTDLAARNAAIDDARNTALAKVDAQAADLYTKLGGIGTIGETHSMATGDGTGTQGLAGRANMGIFYMSYAAATDSSTFVTGINRQTLTFSPSDVTQPVPIHLSATGADQTGNEVTVSRGAQTIKFTVNANQDGTTSLALAQGQGLPQGVKYNPIAQTLTFPPGAEPISVAQKSAGANLGGYDEVQVNVTAFNASTGVPSMSIDFGKLFAPDHFAIDWSTLPADQQQQIERYAKYLAEDPSRKLSLNIQGSGPTDFDGSAMTEISGYGADGSGTSKAEFAGLRSSILDVDADKGTGAITATTDPVHSSLLTTGPNAPLSAAGRTKLAAFMKQNPQLTLNDALSGLRGHAIAELLRSRVQAYGGKTEQIEIASAQIDKKTAFSESLARQVSAGTTLLANLPQ